MTSPKSENYFLEILFGAAFLVASFFCITFAPQMKNERENIIQLIIAALVVLGGMVLLHVGIQIDPKGEIHETVLVAFGEAATFAGSIMGIDYHYKRKSNTNESSSPDTKENGG